MILLKREGKMSVKVMPLNHKELYLRTLEAKVHKYSCKEYDFKK